MELEKLVCTEANAPIFREWIEKRGGLAIWRSINLSNPGASLTTPRLDQQGAPMKPPNWQCAQEPERIITDIAEVLVMKPIEVRRFRVKIRRGSNNPAVFKLTDGSTMKLRAALKKIGEDAWHEFDYATQEAVIFRPGDTRPLEEGKPNG